jgi:hypothetical protein
MSLVSIRETFKPRLHPNLQIGQLSGPENDDSNSLAGNGFPDYLCIDPDGSTTAWINTAMEFVSLGQIKFSEGADRANVRFVDINGDVGICNAIDAPN